MAMITINGISVDPLQQAAAMRSFSLESADASRSNYLIIQSREALDRRKRDLLAELGVTIHHKVPEHSYVAGYRGSDLSGVRGLGFVAWANVYLKAFKVARELLPMDPGPDLLNIAAAKLPQRRESKGLRESLRVDVVLHDDADPNSLCDRIALIGGLDTTLLVHSGRKFRVTVDAGAIDELADLDEVRHIEAVQPAELSDNAVQQIGRADTACDLQPALRGEGEVVAVCDTGFDTGAGQSVHPAFTGRVRRLYSLGRSVANDPDGHGTRVAGAVLGDGLIQQRGRVRGPASGAQLVMQSVMDVQGGLGGLPDNLHDLFITPYENDGARVHNNSWEQRGSAGRYTTASREVDAFVWENRDMVICFAAGTPGTESDGNGIIDYGSIQAPGTAKNCITVGVSESHRIAQSEVWYSALPQQFPVAPVANDLRLDSPDGIAAISGRGPTRDMRVKPDVVAPGTPILSALSRDATGAEHFGASPDSDYTYSGGTSMACPLVAGCAALARQYLRLQFGRQPSAALVKAVLINGCVASPGHHVPSETGEVPNYREGFGRVDLVRALIGAQSDALQLHDESIALDTGEAQSFEITCSGAQTLKATLVWTDPPGEGLQNDLDLIVIAADGQERHGNVPSGRMEYDRHNNVEQVNWSSCPAGRVVITVRAFDIAVHRQPFALVLRCD